MHHFATALCCIWPGSCWWNRTHAAPAEAAKTPTAEAVALKRGDRCVQAEAKEKINGLGRNSWQLRRRAVKLTPPNQKIAVKRRSLQQGGGEG